MNNNKKLVEFIINKDKHTLKDFLIYIARKINKKELKISDDIFTEFILLSKLKPNSEYISDDYCFGFIYMFLSRCSDSQIISIINDEILPNSILKDTLIMRNIDVSDIKKSSLNYLGISSLYLSNSKNNQELENKIIEIAKNDINENDSVYFYAGLSFSNTHLNSLQRFLKIKNESNIEKVIIKTSTDILLKIRRELSNKFLNLGVFHSLHHINKSDTNRFLEISPNIELNNTLNKYEIDLLNKYPDVKTYLKNKVIPTISLYESLDYLTFKLKVQGKIKFSRASKPEFKNYNLFTKIEYNSYFKDINYLDQNILYNLIFGDVNRYEISGLLMKYNNSENINTEIIQGKVYPVYYTGIYRKIKESDIENKSKIFIKNFHMFFNNNSEFTKLIIYILDSENEEFKQTMFEFLSTLDFEKYYLKLKFETLINNFDKIPDKLKKNIGSNIEFENKYCFNNIPIYTENLQKKGLSKDFAKCLGFKMITDIE